MCNNNLAKSACFLTSKDKNDKGWDGTVPEYEKCQLYFSKFITVHAVKVMLR